MGDSRKALTIIAGVFITITVISLGLLILNNGIQLGNTATTKMAKVGQSLEIADLEMYNNGNVSGSVVINAIRIHAENGDLEVSVKTGAATAAVVYTNTNRYTISDPSNINYINPIGEFNSTISKDANGIITRISFVQD